MKSEQETLEKLSALAKVKMSAQKQKEIWEIIGIKIDETKPRPVKYHISIWKTGAAVATAIVLAAGGVYAVSNKRAQFQNRAGQMTSAHQTNAFDVKQTTAVHKTQNQVAVPNLIGTSMQVAKRILSSAGLELAPVGSGYAVRQSISAGILVPRGTKISVTFSGVAQ
ncbi:PASTA domain-containing protein [Alicyclobacillus fodiniaquatilis]|uniref:PASTA domain-containing protein n=1 Tax=Alicyclobacillus fodiniaquatilis TaxID=1661150 RepID=A0ABW4JIE1_9BACL